MPGFLDGNAPKALYAAVASLTVRFPGGRQNYPRGISFFFHSQSLAPPCLAHRPHLFHISIGWFGHSHRNRH